MKDTLNRRVKFREGYRPYAPSVLAEHAAGCLRELRVGNLEAAANLSVLARGERVQPRLDPVVDVRDEARFEEASGVGPPAPLL